MIAMTVVVISDKLEQLGNRGLSRDTANMAEEPKSINADAASCHTSRVNDQPSPTLASGKVVTTATPKDGASKIGDYVPFKQSHLKGQTNPLRPPFHLETVLIGRALGQPTGYVFGVGYRIHDDGHVEAEFADGIRIFETYDKLINELDNLARAEGRWLTGQHQRFRAPQ
jgi:hypothetical protein